MSTNFYWIVKPVTVILPTGPVTLQLQDDDPRIHIGKMSSVSRNGFVMTWAQDSNAVRLACSRNADTVIIVDDNSKEMTGGELLSLLDSVRENKMEWVGFRFC